MNVGDRIKELRKEKGISVDKLAELIGKDRATVYRYESQDIEKMPTSVLEPLAKALGTTPAILMGWEQVENNSFPKRNRHLIPVLGKVIAGYPIEAVENILDYEEISESMARQGDFFALQVKGDSMEPKISEGDVVIVRKQEDVDNGDIAIMLVNGDEATIKKIQKFNGRINLVPSNPAYNVMTYTNEQIEALPVRCLGKVVELRAKF